MNTYFIVVGGLGNQMFMFASALALTRKWGSKLRLINYWYDGKQRGGKFKLFQRYYLLNRFPNIKNDFKKPSIVIQFIIYQLSRFLNRINKNKNNIYYSNTSRYFDSRLFKNKDKKLILMGYYQSFKYFNNIRLEIINYFKLSEEVEKSIRARIDDANNDSKRLLMIHIRREDTLVPGNEWTGLLSIEYYRKAMKMLDAENKCVLIFSDDTAWCREQEIFYKCNIIDESDPVIALRMMQYCDDFIIAGSTLSWWGAWLSESIDKKVLAPFPFYSSVDEQYDSDLIPSEWKKVESEFFDLNIIGQV
jgi:hypothetical protein